MKKIQLTIIICLFSVFTINAQNIDDLIKKGDEAFRAYDMTKAIKVYSEALTTSPTNNAIKEKLANIYMMPGTDNNPALGNKLLSEAFGSGTMSPASLLRYANLLSAQKDFSNVGKVYSAYANAVPSNPMMRSLNTGYFSGIAAPNTSVNIVNVENLNTKNSDFSPHYYKDGIAFVSTRKNRSNTGFSPEIKNNFTDLFKAKLNDVRTLAFSEPTNLLSVENQKYMQGPITFSDEYGVMYITRSILKDDKGYKSIEDKSSVLLEICKVNYSNGDLNNWNHIVPIVLNRSETYQNYSYAHPAFINGKGDEMIFASNMPGGFGGTDLWYSKLNGSEWATPINLGPDVNTAGEELFPFISKDGTLYFASSGLPGLGGLDIFKAAKAGSKYTNPENLGNPFNTSSDDFGFVTNESNREGYLSSNRPGGKGQDDIYSWKSEETKICLKVYAASTGQPISGADVKMPCLGTQRFVTDATGNVCISVKSLKNCEACAFSEGYKNNCIRINNIENNRVIEIPLEKDFEERCKIVVVVLDKETNQPIPDAQINIRRTLNGESVNGTTKEDGRVRARGISMNELYEISASKSMEDGSKYIGLPESAMCKGLKNGDSIVKTIYLTRAKVGTKFKIENIYYDLNKWFIRPEASVELDKIVALMRQYPTMEIEMGSHTDCRSSIKYNEDLSSKRAASAREYIINKGIPASRMTSKGYGESQLTNGCACEGTLKSTCSEAQHQTNRRTEFTITKM